MSMRVIGIVLVAGCLVCGSSMPTFVMAETSAMEQSKSGAASKPTPQQQKMKDCAAKWKQEKATKHVSGRDAYRAFMKECLKG
jgi:hypothetical protein